MKVQMSSVWDRTTAFVSAALGRILPVALLLLFVPISIQLAIAPVVAKEDVATRFVVMVVFWVVELLGTLTIMALALGAAAAPGAAARAALARLGTAVAIFILLFVAAGILAAPMGVGMAMSGVDVAMLRAGRADVSHISAGVGLFVGLYAIAYVVVILWATARLLVIEPVILAERRGIGAIGRAFAMTRGLALRIVGVLILYAIVATIAVLAAQTVFGSILKLLAPDDGDIGVASVITAVIVGAVSTAFKVVAAAFVAKLYQAIGEAAERVPEAA
ncbi:MAG TPA: hypothetical protein VFT56_08675 [Sphingomonas sp.]|nr:hypothetical protein [Sphingomonas sp.]